MQSKNKKKPTTQEQNHIERIKSMQCGVCGVAGPSDCHEMVQGQWFTSIPLCRDCHMGSHNGIHGRMHMWKVLKKDELSVLNETLRELIG